MNLRTYQYTIKRAEKKCLKEWTRVSEIYNAVSSISTLK